MKKLLILVLILIVLIVGVIVGNRLLNNGEDEIISTETTDYNIEKVTVSVEDNAKNGVGNMTEPIEINADASNTLIDEILKAVKENNIYETTYNGGFFEGAPIMYITIDDKTMQIIGCDDLKDNSNGQVVNLIKVSYKEDWSDAKVYKINMKFSEVVTTLYNKNLVADTTMNNKEVKELLNEVMISKEKFISESNEDVYLNKYIIVENQYAEVDKYAYIDLDNDGFDELVILTTSDYGAYIILHYQDEKIYGYMIGIRSFENLKTDGTFMQSNGAANHNYSRISFDKNIYTIKNEAVYDETDSKYVLNNKSSTEELVKSYVKEFEAKSNVKFISL